MAPAQLLPGGHEKHHALTSGPLRCSSDQGRLVHTGRIGRRYGRHLRQDLCCPGAYLLAGVDASTVGCAWTPWVNSQMHRSSKTITNESDSVTTVCFEPWGLQQPLAPGRSFQVVATAEQPGELEIVEERHGFVVFAWPTCTLKVFSADELFEDLCVPVPGVPSGLSVRSFLGAVLDRPPEGSQSA
jgi:hypothetical protein